MPLPDSQMAQGNNQSSSLVASLPLSTKSKVEESDEDIFTVPDMEAPANESGVAKVEVQQNKISQRKRSRNPADREYRRLKSRLLRNRVSAQQARERKKVYMTELESKAIELQDMNAKLEEKISTLINENTMLRKVIMNTRPKVDENVEPLKNQAGHS
ncbi:transcription factor HY5-like isoform X1 [Amborella trichopoda]|uniref:transcription factor HY5-like isoform X1 n=1 Tax=Amborella trichopoda TaxID=13333 RepID=UPI0005D2F890|nr:transcription factor HY5-like isoform X1 [Amborella trichopoda]|eukprot:XP_011621879.1 transcription factor HY5-like isoform X1 [Amborella trichopoda]